MRHLRCLLQYFWMRLPLRQVLPFRVQCCYRHHMRLDVYPGDRSSMGHPAGMHLYSTGHNKAAEFDRGHCYDGADVGMLTDRYRDTLVAVLDLSCRDLQYNGS